MDREKSLLYKIISKLIGLVIFIIIVAILNHYHTTNVWLTDITGFLNTNFVLIISMSLILLIADIFYAAIIPFSLPAPIFSAIGGLLMVTFIFRIFGLIGVILQEDILTGISWLRWIFYPLVFIIMLVSGYISILFETFKTRPKEEKIIDITPKKHKTWKDVDGEFRNMLYDLFSKIRKNIRKK